MSELGVVDARSPIYETEPVGYAAQPAFLNAVVRLQTDLPPVALVERLLAIERGFGRERTFPNAPRRLDLDLLFFDDLIVGDPDAIVPHPRLHQRRFVLVPLAAIAPDLEHPVLRTTVADLLAQLEDDGGVRLFASDVWEPTSDTAAGHS
jgi:2-amino-4-hydroxy-6-hydroxymethyldihydropteridine diphosphokinase